MQLNAFNQAAYASQARTFMHAGGFPQVSLVQGAKFTQPFQQ